MSENTGPLNRMARWAKGLIVQDVPEGDALCAFDCGKEQCTLGEWEHCERRVQKAAGELMPADASASTEKPECKSPTA